jgi:hypothetical protein
MLVGGARNASGQSVSLGAELGLSNEPDANHAFGFTVSLRPIGPIELRMSKSRAEAQRFDMTCGTLEPDCRPEQVETIGRLQSWFVGYVVALMKRRSAEVLLVPEVGFVRLDGTRSGVSSGRTVTKRGDYLGIGLRGEVLVWLKPIPGLFVKGEAGARSLMNPAIGESLDAYDPYRDNQRMGIVALAVGYSL